MARETKEQRRLREAEETSARAEARKAAYPEYLLATLRRATRLNYELAVSAQHTFLLFDRDDPDNEFELSHGYSESSHAALYELDWTLETKEKETREQQRRAEVRKNALNKLTEEERELLNV